MTEKQKILYERWPGIDAGTFYDPQVSALRSTLIIIIIIIIIIYKSKFKITVPFSARVMTVLLNLESVLNLIAVF